MFDMPEWTVPREIDVRIDEGELRRWTDSLIATRAGTDRYRPIYVVSGILWILTAIMRLSFHHHALQKMDVAYAMVTGALGVLYLFSATYRGGPSIVRVRSATLTIDDARVTMRGDANLTIPWSGTARIIDVGDAFVIERFRDRPAIAIPKNALADGGAGLWSFFERRILGTRMLARPDRLAAIVNSTGALFLLRVR